MNQPARALSPVPSPANARTAMERIATQLDRAVQGKPSQLQLVVTSLVAGGHVLLEDVPGVGKTTLAEALAKACGLSFARVQFTADLMPADVLGAQVFHAQTATFQFRPGPLFRQLVLADELNRAPPRTQSALLEAMAQGQVSLDGATHALPAPFTVVATQNPVDFSGTYPLPDSQLDRFMVRMSLGHPTPEVEAGLLVTRDGTPPLDAVETVSEPEELASLRSFAAALRLDASVADYVVRLATATRSHGDLERGASTRAVLALGAAARAHALWDARDFATPGDVRAVLLPCWAHRIMLRSAVQGVSARDEAAHLLEEIARKVPAPR
ncbi:AAA family ATPase [Myxococcus xanthus]|uniref:AAA domain-containing protein n=1 Tax=Myxococcus xanthus TaxID=34 RepID=A0A7Y4IQN7_MYXXA|nr:AAA family ATPase [Myxococcus xanthus]NOJ83225.1 AAA domain-containing protein [Myxococcus xanthus]NOJ90356.1 AAA domain-containing protein [Myxococcus xanthus]